MIEGNILRMWNDVGQLMSFKSEDSEKGERMGSKG